MKSSFYIFLAIVTLSLAACTNKQIKGEGTINVQGITTYQYGTHTIYMDGEFYALRSSHVNLDDYVNQYVAITAEKVEGYPIEDGPVYLEVISVQ